MTTAFQTVFDNAASISINRRRKVSQTTSRSGVVKSTSLGGQVWEFEVSLPDGPSWQEYRPLIERMEALDRVTVGQVQINNPGHSWLSGYQGDLPSVSSITASYSSGNTITLTGGFSPLSSGQKKFVAGDIIQLGTGGVYSVAADVEFNVNTVTLHRPVLDAAGTYTLKVGPAVVWNVICVQFPKWTIFARDQISWDGPFVFAEAI
jgi:hypothetical protein